MKNLLIKIKAIIKVLIPWIKYSIAEYKVLKRELKYKSKKDI